MRPQREAAERPRRSQLSSTFGAPASMRPQREAAERPAFDARTGEHVATMASMRPQREAAERHDKQIAAKRKLRDRLQ